jgi:hypothetical protein
MGKIEDQETSNVFQHIIIYNLRRSMFFKKKDLDRQKDLESQYLTEYLSLLRARYANFTSLLVLLDNQLRNNDLDSQSNYIVDDILHNPIFEMINKIESFQEGPLRVIENHLQHTFGNGDLLIPLFISKNVKNVFKELFDKGRISQDLRCQLAEFVDWYNGQAENLALLGDRIIDFSLFFDSISNNHSMNLTKEDINHLRIRTENFTFSHLFSKWGFDEFVFPMIPHLRDQEQKSSEDKAMIIEFLYAIIFIEKGFEGYIDLVVNTLPKVDEIFSIE